MPLAAHVGTGASLHDGAGEATALLQQGQAGLGDERGGGGPLGPGRQAGRGIWNESIQTFLLDIIFIIFI